MHTQIHDRNMSMQKFVLAIVFVLECFALPAQFYLLVINPNFTFFEAVVRFFSFFTILTNSMVTACCGVLLLGRKSDLYEFFRKNTTLTAITVYIIIVGLVYNIILRPLQHLQGLHSMTNEVFHTVVPILFLIYWSLFVPKNNLSWKSIAMWTIYPMVYVIYTLIHGKYSRFYPYPFIDVGKLGFEKAMTNGMFVLLAFVVLSLVLVGVAKMRKGGIA